MNKAIILSALAASLLASFAAHAADTTELKVKGVIRPAACSPSFVGSNTIDYGTISATSLKAGQYTKLSTKTASLTVTCDAATKVALTFTDNRAASVVTGILNGQGIFGYGAETQNYGLGSVGGKKVGGYTISFDTSTTIDGVAATNVYSDNKGGSWTNGAINPRQGQYLSFGLPAAPSLPAAFKTLNVTMNINTVLNKPEELTLTGDVPLDGSTTIEVLYL